MTPHPIAALLSLAAGWILWAYSYESYENRRTSGNWTRVLTVTSEEACEQKKREQVTALLNSLAPRGASVDRSGDTVFYTAKARNGRPIIKGTRYLCLQEDVDPSG